jgi:site-specific DNA-cytosine methylase
MYVCLDGANMHLRVLELYSGLGGMHYALKSIGELDFEVVRAYDINVLANQVYSHNHGDGVAISVFNTPGLRSLIY